MFDIVLIENGDDNGTVVQYAYTHKQAIQLIEKVLPKTNSGYHYKIVKQ